MAESFFSLGPSPPRLNLIALAIHDAFALDVIGPEV